MSEKYLSLKKPTARTVFARLFVPDIAPMIGSKQVMFSRLSVVSSTSSGSYSEYFKSLLKWCLYRCLSRVFQDSILLVFSLGFQFNELPPRNKA